MIRRGFWGPFYYAYKLETPQDSVGISSSNGGALKIRKGLWGIHFNTKVIIRNPPKIVLCFI